MENPYTQMSYHDPALFYEIINAFEHPEIHQQKTFKSSSENTEASATDTQVRQYVCHLCRKGMASKWGFKIHMADHSAIKKYKCNKCKFGTNNSSNFARHLKRKIPCTLDEAIVA